FGPAKMARAASLEPAIGGTETGDRSASEPGRCDPDRRTHFRDGDGFLRLLRAARQHARIAFCGCIGCWSAGLQLCAILRGKDRVARSRNLALRRQNKVDVPGPGVLNDSL